MHKYPFATSIFTSTTPKDSIIVYKRFPKTENIFTIVLLVPESYVNKAYIFKLLILTFFISKSTKEGYVKIKEEDELNTYIILEEFQEKYLPIHKYIPNSSIS